MYLQTTLTFERSTESGHDVDVTIEVGGMVESHFDHYVCTMDKATEKALDAKELRHAEDMLIDLASEIDRAKMVDRSECGPEYDKYVARGIA
jgi:hypothetical protein